MKILILFALLPFVSALASSLPSDPKRQPSSSDGAIHLAVYHRANPSLPARPFAADLDFSSILERDDARLRSIAAAPPTEATLVYDYSAVQDDYAVLVYVGTPYKAQFVTMSTTSSITWLRCLSCSTCYVDDVTRSDLFDPSVSSTYQAILCTDAWCEERRERHFGCNRTRDECMYRGNSGADYTVSTDVLSLNYAEGFPGFVFGCEEVRGDRPYRSNGAISLVDGRLSLFSQLAPTAGYRAFSVCLPRAAANEVGFLRIGRPPASAAVRYTPLVSARGHYVVRLAGVQFGDSTYFAAEPMMVAVEMGLTQLHPELYVTLREEVLVALVAYKRAPAYNGSIDVCFESGQEGFWAAVPTVRLAFRGGAVLELGAYSVMVDVNARQTCLGFLPAASHGVAVLGNHQLQGFLVVYDVEKSRVGFAPHGEGCSN